MAKSLGKHAIVGGAGIGGLTAAKALSSHFDKVTVLERDALPSGPSRASERRNRGISTRSSGAAAMHWNPSSSALKSSSRRRAR